MRSFRAWLAGGLCLAVAVIGGHRSASADRPAHGSRASALDVPFVPQREALCGGAALAMVMRYWKDPAVLADDFAHLIEPAGTGIRTDDLVSAVRGRRWSAYPAGGTPQEIRDHLTRGRPVIALLAAGSGRLHYVVVVGWSDGWVIVHDPAVGPFRAVSENTFSKDWSGGGRWYLLVLPPTPADPPGLVLSALPEASSGFALQGCDAVVEEGIRLARVGDALGAERCLLAARVSCPTSAAPVRELTGLRFTAGDWKGATRLAEQALALDPDDSLATRLLAGSRFLDGDVAGALRTWNRISEPHTDLTRVDGLVRTRYGVVAAQVDLPPGRLLTPPAYARARRRLAELPTQSGSRLSLGPRAAGKAQLNVAMLERPLLFTGPRDAGQTAVRSLLERELQLQLASPTGNGELWSAQWRWWRDRPRVSLALAVPAAGGRPGVWRVEGVRDWQSYAVAARVSGDPAPREVVTEDRRRTSLSFADWVAASLRIEGGVALDRWRGRGNHLALEGKFETRLAGDRLIVEADLAGWNSLEGGRGFAAGGVRAEWSPKDAGAGGWRARAGVSAATVDAPLALWSGAGTGTGRAHLLRAHPLLKGGVLEGRAFGRVLLHGGVERQGWVWTAGPLRLGWALFLDGARPWDPLGPTPVPVQFDAGAGIRLTDRGSLGQLRIDLARGLADGRTAISVAWEVR